MHHTFDCSLLNDGDPKVFRAVDTNGAGLYYVAGHDGSYAYSRTRNKAVKNVKLLARVKEFESKPVDFVEKMDLYYFVFYYKDKAAACADVKANLLREIDNRGIVRQAEYTFQQWICFSIHRHNFEYFKIHVSMLPGAPDHIHAYHDCRIYKQRFNINCPTQLLEKIR
ncbi:MAG: hypothetical protein LBF37_04160 [Rickettsiales bacterium]|nr:hypothetical protein [Rickettsiales bacterium]